MVSRRSLLLAWEVTAEQEEPWRRLLQDLSGPRRAEFAESRRGLGISVEAVWLAPKSAGGGVAVVYLETEDPARALRELTVSTTAFDSWYREEMRRLFSCNFERSTRVAPGELLFAWPQVPGEEEQEPREGPADTTATGEGEHPSSSATGIPADRSLVPRSTGRSTPCS